ncbi:MAG TPA: prepilin-type N-terminal cleavage/methylation domain-containing protein [Chitinispirillaceae bacterium]|nr:prepilin-type N-terminal cleavage/methylation domain-containing protein [Chitinispirillaceae bacterium]
MGSTISNRFCRPSSAGFTFLELIVVMVITAVISTYAVVSLSRSILYNQLQKASFETMAELSGIRPLALKNDNRMIVRFSASSCSVYVDQNCDTLGQASEFIKSWEMGKNVMLGLPSRSPPASAPSGSELPVAGNVAAGQWAKAFLITNDALGTINSGCLYLYSPKLAKRAYCITSYTSQSLKIFSWNGTSWTAQ